MFVVSDYHVHTKCYIFKENGGIKNILVGSANCSINGLRSGKNSELLVDLNKNELINQHYLNDLDLYCSEVTKSSLPIDDGQILVSSQSVTTRSKGTGRNKYKISKNPFVALIPLFRIKGTKKVVPDSSGLNWGNQKGHTKKGSMESYFAVTAELINNHPIVFPFKTQKRNTTSGKITRDRDPITVLWDDGTVMEMIFSGTGVERPSKGDRTPNNPYRQYPKQLTSADGVVLNWGHISEEWDYHLLTKLQCQI
ncbi:restriction endonuclease PLD domain-containing protein [Streptococcus thermophilus]|nr:NgoFVII family restriction endonuclease [Streptococcus thermophilus]MCE2200362.1 NgoFVII family restriction endonuclease [Streptococcus thermophilus]